MDAPPLPPPRSPLRPPPPPAAEPVLSKRQHALHELLSSERAYASDLALMLEVHIPLAQGPMTQEDIKIIFGNIAELAELSDAFCEALEQIIGSALDDPDATDDRVGGLFLRYAPELEAPYKQYITRHPSALAHLTALPSTPELTAYHATTRDAAASLSHAWDLASLLIKPVQRLLKYSLLLGAIIDATALTHPDRPTLLLARTAMEDVARAVNEGRRRAEVVKEVLSAPKKPPTVLRIKSFRAPADVNSEAARVDRMAAELARIDVFAQQLSRTGQEWARAADTSAHALLNWARAFAAAIGLSSTVRSEAFDAFLDTLTTTLLPRSAALLPQVASDLLAPLARLLASAAQPRLLLASMGEHAPLHHHLLTMPVSPKNRPPPALLDASARYLALRVQLAAELPAYLSLLHRGLAALVRRLAAVQAAFFHDARDAWAGLWDMLRVEGERNGGGAETEAVWRARWGDVDLGVQSLAVCQPLRVVSQQQQQQLTPAEAFARGYTDPINTNINAYGGIGSPDSAYSGGASERNGNGNAPLSPHYDRRSSSTTSMHSRTSDKGAHVTNALAALEPPRRAPVNVSATTAMMAALQPSHAHTQTAGSISSGYSPPSLGNGHSPLQVSGPFQLMPGRPRRGSDAYSTTAGSTMGGSTMGGSTLNSFSGWNANEVRGKSPSRTVGNGNGNGRAQTVRGKSPTPTNRTAMTMKDGRAEFGEYVSEMGWGDYGGTILPPKKPRDVGREEEKAREKERERQRKQEREEAKEREKARKKEEKKEKKSSSSKNSSADPSPRSSLASSRMALLEGAGYGGYREKPKSKSKSTSGDSERRGVARRASDLTNNNSGPSRGPSRPPSRGRSFPALDEPPNHTQTHTYASPRAAPRPPSHSQPPGRPPPPPGPYRNSDPPLPSPNADAEDFKARRSTWLVAPAQYSCRVVHPCTPPSAVSYFGFPFFALEEHALLGVLHEAGHPSTHPRLPLYVDEGEDCLLLCRDAAGEIGWALASFLAPLASD
ncbi:hypothetical protein B0H16DRAFT_367049 [Mycena metata]|uniref:DH domain-containing protein n=1 Tax=Mycena metata TaxID=1033252 RepID=A0AAD7HJV5_9AGAR|nr:hypothetical protein B0H16DRAFT_367049 [Mycena metata]